MKRKQQMRKRRRFLSSIFLILIMGLSLSFLQNAIAGGNEPPNFIEITVQPGDSLWQIAKDINGKEKDIRSLIYEIRQLNNLSDVSLIPGQTIKIPTIPN